ncbi:MAG: Asp-tRNA(Asn)/Glu-tRNA(Gln) amidotransferase subunit GatC [Alphaproteobacteria bacterium]|nr:Asp-tRNA(Asn)/Glu-tRNA(Gln) amidotransferase subunit GatC [Alphaproteobacteria bacterium]
MALDKATVARIATLARIKVADRDLDRMVGELQTILNWVEELNTVDTDGVEPMTSAVEVTLPMREDKISDGGYATKVLANATEPVTIGEGGFFTVPKVVE